MEKSDAEEQMKILNEFKVIKQKYGAGKKFAFRKINWTRQDLNLRPPRYQRGALTKLSYWSII